MLPFIVAALAALLVAGVLLVMLRKPSESSGPRVVHVAAPARGGMNRMQGGMRRRRGQRVAEADDSDEEDVGRGRRAGRRRGQQEEEEEEAAVPKVSKRDAYEARRAARDAERDALEAAQEEEFRRAAEERQRREEEDAAKWMHTFTVEAAGEEAETAEEAEALLDRLVEYIKARKAVALDELAAEFRLHTQEVICRVQALEEVGRLTGVMDDRGKYIYISMDEMQAACDYIRKCGRIAISELARSSEAFIDLTARDVGPLRSADELELGGAGAAAVGAPS